MRIKDLELVTELYSELEYIEFQLKNIQKQAIKLSEGKFKVFFMLELEPEVSNNKVKVDEEGFTTNPSQGGFPVAMIMTPQGLQEIPLPQQHRRISKEEEEEREENTFAANFSESQTLSLLETIRELCLKRKREIVIQLKKLGVKRR